MKTLVLTLFAVAILAAACSAQTLELKLDAIAAKATDKTEVDLDGATLAAGQKLAGEQIPKELRAMAAGLREVHVRSYEFAKAGDYSEQDLEPVRKQVGQGTGWSRIVNVREKDESTEIYILNRDDKVAGFFVLNAEAKELNLVYIVGSMPLDKLVELVNSNVHYDLKNVVAAQAQ